MTFGRRKSSSQPQAVPAPATPQDSPVRSSGNPIVRYVQDSYNGIYKILLEPNMPTRRTVALLVAGLLLGLLWGYYLAPIEFAGANPHRLNQSARDQWILMAAGNFDRLFYDETETARLLSQVENPAAAVERLLQSPTITPSDREALLRIQPIAQTVTGTPAPRDPGLLGNLWSGLILPLLIVLIGTPALVLLWRLLIYGNFVAPLVQRVQETRDPALRARNDANRAELRRLKEQRAELDRLRRDQVADHELGEPVVQLLKVFQSGRPYDESNEIEVGEEFLGQCGSVIPDALSGDPLALEVWLFDMQATGDKNFRKLFLTEAAAADPNLVAHLMAEAGIGPNDLAVIQPGAKLVLEGETLRLTNEISSVEFAPNGRIAALRMKVTAWRRTAGAPMPAYSPAPAAGYAAPSSLPQAMTPPAPASGAFSGFSAPRPLATLPPSDAAPLHPLPGYDNLDFDPPPVPPARSQPAAPVLRPPTLPTEDDDPFGNTGDFTPLPPRR